YACFVLLAFAVVENSLAVSCGSTESELPHGTAATAHRLRGSRRNSSSRDWEGPCGVCRLASRIRQCRGHRSFRRGHVTLCSFFSLCRGDARGKGSECRRCRGLFGADRTCDWPAFAFWIFSGGRKDRLFASSDSAERPAPRT